jgi:hypothetical protein
MHQNAAFYCKYEPINQPAAMTEHWSRIGKYDNRFPPDLHTTHSYQDKEHGIHSTFVASANNP